MSDSINRYFRPNIGPSTFCKGCGHGILSSAVLRAVERLAIQDDRLLFVSGIGCAAWIPSPYYNFDTLHTLHGRAVAFAVGAKLANPNLTVIVISGDGDLLSIGGNHLIHAARRNIDLTVICANNYIYGMTGGQTASTSPKGTFTVTAPFGVEEKPFDACALVTAAGASCVSRFPVTRPEALSTSIEEAISHRGFSFVEALSPCPTQYGRRNGFACVTDLYDALDAAWERRS
jgi:2-oxoglutarate/2-oxoacid ferredoxin oxidoreductase subunit beta